MFSTFAPLREGGTDEMGCWKRLLGPDYIGFSGSEKKVKINFADSEKPSTFAVPSEAKRKREINAAFWQ